MTNYINLTWPERFALIDHYSPSSEEVICTIFQVTSDELAAARTLRAAGTLTSSSSFDVAKYGNPFDGSSKTPVVATIHARPESATKREKAPLKRGRKGNKIESALLAIPTTPITVESFQQQYNVSLAVLRQSKRFLQKLEPAMIQKIGKINVRKDKVTKSLMIWREHNGE